MLNVNAPPRVEPSILHLDLDAFFAAVEQRDKPSLRGKPVIVGGLGPRGVVSTASYEARRFGVGSAMPMTQARARCPHAAFLAGRFGAYRRTSNLVMAALAELSPLVEPLSLDEAFVDLSAGQDRELSPAAVHRIGTELRATVAERTGVTASVGAATSKLIAKIASEQAKPDGIIVVEPGTERDVLRPLPVRALLGVGPATADRLARMGVRTVGELADVTESELVDVLGEAHGHSLHRLANGQDDRPVETERESKSVSVEDTFDHDITDPVLLRATATRMARSVADRLVKAGLSGRTVTLKARTHDFATNTRSATLPGPTDDARTITRLATALLDEIDVTDGIRLLGVGVSGLADWVQEDLFVTDEDQSNTAEPAQPTVPPSPTRWVPGMDVVHDEHGPGWVWGSGLGRVTIRFETAATPPGPVRTFPTDDPSLHLAE
jgi:DNA polymerase-4